MTVEFIDTNVLVYAFDKSAGDKHDIAVDLFKRVTSENAAIFSIQVLMELYVTLTRKIRSPLTQKDTAEIIREVASWSVFSPSPSDVLDAIQISNSCRISLWDSMIVQAAVKTKASVIWTEDLNDGQVFEGVRVKNPFTKLR